MGEGLHKYKIRKPSIGHHIIKHERNSGWKRLAIKALNILIKKEELMNNNFDVKKGKRICYLGNLSHKKGYQTLFMAMQAIVEYDPEFTLGIAGRIDESRAAVFMDTYSIEQELQNNIIYHGFVEKPLEFLVEHDFIINTSPLEGHCISMMQGLSVGLTPLFFNHVGVRDQYPPDYIWSTFPQLIEMLKKGVQPKEKYIKFVKENYSLDKQLTKINEIIENMLEKTPKKHKIPEKSTVSCVLAVKNGRKTLLELMSQTSPL